MDRVDAGVHLHLALRLSAGEDPGQLELALAHLGRVAAAGAVELGGDVEAEAPRDGLQVLEAARMHACAGGEE